MNSTLGHAIGWMSSLNLNWSQVAAAFARNVELSVGGKESEITIENLRFRGESLVDNLFRCGLLCTKIVLTAIVSIRSIAHAHWAKH